ncbi:MAG: response regulator [Polyangiaceae bacterium]
MRPVLVVDDDAVSRHVLVHTLTAAGLVPAPVPDGEAALKWLEHSQPCLILLDLIMPGTDGYSVLKHIRAHSALADVPVVVLTALDSDDEIRRIFAEGADDYVHKPFRPTELVARLTGQLRMRDYVERLGRRERYAQLAVELTQKLASSPGIRSALLRHRGSSRRMSECRSV